MLRRRPLAVLSATALALSGFGTLALNTTAEAASVSASDLMFSTYIEGSSNNKAIEVYNPTTAAVDMSSYLISLYVNGKTTTQATLSPQATIAPGGYYVITSSQADKADLIAKSNATSGVTAFNGNDVLTLTKGSVTVDSIGQLGTDEYWATDGVSMTNMTLTKKGCTVDNDETDAYNPSVDFAASSIDNFATLGTLTCDLVEPTDPPGPTEPPAGEVIAIGTVQGEGDTSPYVGKNVTVKGHVVGSFQDEFQFGGYYVQDGGDDNDATSDGIFVYAPGAAKLSIGTHVKVTGAVSEAFGQTQISPSTVTTVDEAGTPPEALELEVPIDDPERYEGMLLTFPDELTILEYFQFGRYGSLVVGPERQNTPSAVVDPGPLAIALANLNSKRRLTIDDGRTKQNATPALHPNGRPLSKDNFFRGGDKLVDVTGIMSYRDNEFKLQPTVGAEYINANPRTDVPDVGGNFTVASYNVLNYFTTFKNVDPNARGALNAEEFERQQQKIVAALAEIDADVFGLIEIENNGGTAVKNLVTALNSNIGSETYAYVNTGKLGSDAITQAFIYKSATTELSGTWQALDFKDQKNRPVLVQTFTHKASGEKVNISVNHLKSKGSNCNSIGDPDLGDGAANCNLTRTKAANAMATFLAGDPTDQGADRSVILGDLNSYDHEDPIKALEAAGYTDMEKQFGGEYAYSYVFDGQIGYLDYAMANDAARADITGATAWHINADEAPLLDYTMGFKEPAEQALWEPTPFRSSDHDPVIVGMKLGAVVNPDIEVTPVNAVFTQPTCDAGATVTIPTTTGIDYLVNGGKAISGETYPLNAGGTNIMTAVAQEGYVIKGEFSQTIAINEAPDCRIEVTPVNAVFTQPTCDAGATVTIPTTTGIDYLVNGGKAISGETYPLNAGGTNIMTAVAQEGYVIKGEFSQTIAINKAPVCPTEPTPSPSQHPSATPTVTPTPPAVDIYTTPGFHEVNGRKWMTTCEPYSATTRCFTNIWSTQVRYVGGKYVQVTGWNFNNLTYVAAPRALWVGNKLAYTNEWTANGRNWRTECETAQTGRGGCRSYTETKVIEATGSGYRQVTKFVFNNMVRFSD